MKLSPERETIMIRVIMCGCNGRMGHVIRNIISERDDMQIVAGVDRVLREAAFPQYENIMDCKEDADVIIDFSSPKAIDDGLLKFAEAHGMAVVLCTTGFSSEQLGEIEAASRKLAILRSGNMSLGINTVSKLIKEAAKILADNGFDIEIVEKHHNNKLDAPSGTAILLADSINEEFDGRYEYVYDRSERREKRPKDEIGISSVRGGSIVGEHEVIFAGLDEVIEIRHTAYSRAIFGKGAVAAAAFLAGKPAGMYSMNDVIG